MKIKLPVLKWLFLIGYITIAFFLCFHGYIIDTKAYLIIFAVMIVSQFLFLFTSPSGNFCKPSRRGRVVFPVVIASVMMSVLVYGMINTLLELFKCNFIDRYILIAVIVSWFIWLIVFYFYTRKKDSSIILKSLLSFIIKGSLVELLVAVASHVVTSRRPGCLANLGTGIGIVCGLCVMMWAFGPGLYFMFTKSRQIQLDIDESLSK